MDGGKLIAVWDCGEPGWWDDRREARAAWVAAQGLPVTSVYRVEFHDDPPRARFFCYALNAEGRRHFTHAPGDCTPEHGTHCVAREEPRMLALAALPPAGLR